MTNIEPYIYLFVGGIIAAVILLRPLYIYLGRLEAQEQHTAEGLAMAAKVIKELTLRVAEHKTAIGELASLIEAGQEVQQLLHDRIRFLEKAYKAEHPGIVVKHMPKPTPETYGDDSIDDVMLN